MERRFLRTFVFTNVFQSKCEAIVLAFDDADFAERTLANNSEELEMIKLHCVERCVSRRPLITRATRVTDAFKAQCPERKAMPMTNLDQ